MVFFMWFFRFPMLDNCTVWAEPYFNQIFWNISNKKQQLTYVTGFYSIILLKIGDSKHNVVRWTLNSRQRWRFFHFSVILGTVRLGTFMIIRPTWVATIRGDLTTFLMTSLPDVLTSWYDIILYSSYFPLFALDTFFCVYNLPEPAN